jgi:DNA-binding Xre family transcriptional regulator
MTKLGEFLKDKSVNKAEISRRSGITTTRMNELTTNLKSRLLAQEVYDIAVAMGVSPGELLEFVCGGAGKK